MKKVFSQCVEEYIYDTEEERELHVYQMENKGWEDMGSRRCLKEGVSIFDVKEDDYQWYAKFIR